MLTFSKLNFHPPRLTWFGNFLHDHKQFVNANICPYDATPVISDVPQGSVLSLPLFLIFIDDIAATVSRHTRLSADDCVLPRTISNPFQHTAQLDDKKIFRKGAPLVKCPWMLMNLILLPSLSFSLLAIFIIHLTAPTQLPLHLTYTQAPT